jgi:hypothetical protein
MTNGHDNGDGDSAVATEQQGQTLHGRRPGSRYVRIIRPSAEDFATDTPLDKDKFRTESPDYLVAEEGVLEPQNLVERGLSVVWRTMVGRRIASHREIHERLGKVKGLAVFASDNISSSAYATEEIMRVLVLAGIGALTLTMPITIAIVCVLAVVVISYQQTIRAYPNGGGSYIVASDNLGKLPGLTAAGALPE